MFKPRVTRIMAAALVLSFYCFGAEPPPKELMQYIAEAQKLGLEEEAIRRNASAAGWDSKIVDEAFLFLRRPPDSSSDAYSMDLPEGYRIGAGDILKIDVWKEPEASVDAVVVRADGKISLPLLKEVEIAGLAPPEAEKLLAKKFAKFLVSADVTVIVKAVNSWKVYLVGAVRNVGPIPLVSRMTVLQAIALAGGVNDYAKRKKIYILRTVHGRQMRLPFNYEAVIKGEQIEQNIVVEPEDIIVVPQ